MTLLRRAVLTFGLCLALAAGPFTHGFLTARAAAAPAPGSPALASLSHHCDGAMAAAPADADSHDDAGGPRPDPSRAGGCLTLCCAMAPAAMVFDVARPARPRPADRRPAGEDGGVVRPPLPPPRD